MLLVNTSHGLGLLIACWPSSCVCVCECECVCVCATCFWWAHLIVKYADRLLIIFLCVWYAWWTHRFSCWPSSRHWVRNEEQAPGNWDHVGQVGKNCRSCTKQDNTLLTRNACSFLNVWLEMSIHTQVTAFYLLPTPVCPVRSVFCLICYWNSIV